MDDHPPTNDAVVSARRARLRVTPAKVALGDLGRGQPAYLGHRLQHRQATLVASVDGSALAPGEQAGLAVVAKESNFLAAMLVREASGAAMVLYRRAGPQQPGTGTELARTPLPDATQPVKLRFALDAARVHVDYAVGQG